MKTKEVGKWAFLIGVVLSILSAFTSNLIAPSTMIIIIFVLGLIVGFLNIERKSSSTFLIAVILLLVLGVGGISALSGISFFSLYDILVSMLAGFVTFVGAAGLVVAIKVILNTNEGLFSAMSVSKKKKKR